MKNTFNIDEYKNDIKASTKLFLENSRKKNSLNELDIPDSAYPPENDMIDLNTDKVNTTPGIPSENEPAIQINADISAVPEFEMGVQGVEPIIPTQLNNQIVDMFNERIGDEYTAHYFYTNAGRWCVDMGYIEAGTFFLNEADSELEHAKKLQSYLVSWNVTPTIPKVDTVSEMKSLVDCINKAYNLEYDLFKKYDEMSRHVSQVDLATFDFLQEFRKIQNDSVAEYADMLNKLKLIDHTDKFQLFYFEKTNFGD